jgi:hypothetical protein
MSGSLDDQTVSRNEPMTSAGPDHLLPAVIEQGPGASQLYAHSESMEVDLTWMGTYANGAAGPATGTFVLAGQIYCVGQGSQVVLNDNVPETFRLVNIGKGSCPGTPISGYLDGCFQFSTR